VVINGGFSKIGRRIKTVEKGFNKKEKIQVRPMGKCNNGNT